MALPPIIEVIKQGEGGGIEFKRSIDFISSSPDSVERTVAALANSSPDKTGLLIFGVEDDGTLLGLRDLSGIIPLPERLVRKRRQQFAQIVARIRPVPVYTWQELHHAGYALEVVSIQGRSGNLVYTTSTGTVPYRIDSYTFYADSEQIDAWRQIAGLRSAKTLEDAICEWKVRARGYY